MLDVSNKESDTTKLQAVVHGSITRHVRWMASSFTSYEPECKTSPSVANVHSGVASTQLTNPYLMQRLLIAQPTYRANEVNFQHAASAVTATEEILTTAVRPGGAHNRTRDILCHQPDRFSVDSISMARLSLTAQQSKQGGDTI